MQVSVFPQRVHMQVPQTSNSCTAHRAHKQVQSMQHIKMIGFCSILLIFFYQGLLNTSFYSFKIKSQVFQSFFNYSNGELQCNLPSVSIFIGVTTSQKSAYLLRCILTLRNRKCFIIKRHISCWPLWSNKTACSPGTPLMDIAQEDNRCNNEQSYSQEKLLHPQHCH